MVFLLAEIKLWPMTFICHLRDHDDGTETRRKLEANARGGGDFRRDLCTCQNAKTALWVYMGRSFNGGAATT
jgi:hypothetical protein